MEEEQNKMEKLEQDLEEKIIASENLELIESYMRFKTGIYEYMKKFAELL